MEVNKKHEICHSYVLRFRFRSIEMVWILTRERNADMETMKKAYDVLDRNKISKGYLMRTDQFNCNPENMTYILRDEMIL